MTYETINWELEAKRVARAFGIEGECEFDGDNKHSKRLCCNENPSRGIWIYDGNPLNVTYMFDRLYFCVLGKSWTEVSFDWGGHVIRETVSTEHSLFLAKSLYHLNLLTPAVEAALGVAITAHEKLEWMREYEDRYGVMG